VARPQVSARHTASSLFPTSATSGDQLGDRLGA